MSYSLNIKGKENPKDKQLVKLEMVFFQTGYARVSKILDITGAYKDWDNETQSFKSKGTETATKNKLLLDMKMQYLRVIEDWEAANEPWSPVQWSHSLDNTQTCRRDEPKVITVVTWLEGYMERCRNTERVKNGNIVTCDTNARRLGYFKVQLDKFTLEQYGRSFSTYFFRDINEQFIKDFIAYIEKLGLDNGNKGGLCTKLRLLRGMCSNANKDGIPGAKVSQFNVAKEKMVWGNVTPKTIPYGVFQKIEEIDRDYFTEEEQFYLDLFLFSFYAGGMGDKDVCYLTWDCIQGNMLIYERMKTTKCAKMVLTDKALKIINKYKEKSVGNFVLPIFQEKHITEKQKESRIKTIERKVNNLLERVRGMVMYPEKITWYSARGTFITKMADSGFPTIVIAEFAGNSIQAIQKHYFKNTKHEEMRMTINNLI